MHAVDPALVPMSVIEPAAHSVQELKFDAVEYLPGSHCVHLVAPASTPVSVIDPAPHSMHALTDVKPVPLAYLPASQLVQEASVGSVEYFPAGHAVQVEAPALLPVSVTDPLGHSAHEPLDAVENLPDLHFVQDTAPGAAPVFVVDPATHSMHMVSAIEPVLLVYLPAPHLIQPDDPLSCW